MGGKRKNKGKSSKKGKQNNYQRPPHDSNVTAKSLEDDVQDFAAEFKNDLKNGRYPQKKNAQAGSRRTHNRRQRNTRECAKKWRQPANEKLHFDVHALRADVRKDPATGKEELVELQIASTEFTLKTKHLQSKPDPKHRYQEKGRRNHRKQNRTHKKHSKCHY